MWLDSAAHVLYTPTMHGKRIAVARWHHHIHLVPGWLFKFICDRFEASLWRGTPDFECCPHITYSSLPGLTCGCGRPVVRTTSTNWQPEAPAQ
jgi:hypothetical protein